ncbi:hypothetical protein HOE37_01975 [Candidatus Woesearchaeota archaeon]|mgnify:FL=1|jgi:hypothetical protein|nr:hypothetical protein [Candidatus Woesearchaeota archaeon]MBT4110602.1 hypothetical protein [Candidatus Woesearchaeota archaeon]MBT4335874.1 hypothetical protein [Candidatus Woesearchaeota archaeon]MBT4469147.1 hypothetical protein [Candidatus Woesearchaeota archaeon]MBT6744534.1 hypothetical protein [Candidatus Woesearchaeota archaeon]
MKYIKETVNDKVYFEEILSEGNMGRVVCQEENGDSTKGSAKDFFQACSSSDHSLFGEEPPKPTYIEISKEEFENVWDKSKEKSTKESLLK